jgi:branched-subunit amino acid aminotransferase/4-amino-4-deoxychorismate lyase
MKAYVNGKFVDLSRARLAIHDAAVQHAVGLFETMQAFNGQIFRLDDHIDRIIRSAKQTGLTDRLRHEALAELTQRTVDENRLTEARVRLTVTGGDLSLLSAARSGGRRRRHNLGILCVASEPTSYPKAFFSDGVAVVVADPKANPFDPFAGHKTINYWARLQSLATAAAAEAGEALWLSVTNHLCSGAVSNVILIRDNQLLTPYARGEEAQGAIPSPVLPGITRAAVLELAEQLDLPVQRKMLTINDVLEADEVLLTNSSWQILPVVRVEKHHIGQGTPGPWTRRLREALLDSIAGQTESIEDD